MKLVFSLVLVLSSCIAFSAPVMVSGTVPHFYEFNPIENPSFNYWCGHTALKIVGVYTVGVNKSLTSLHNTFYANSPNGYAKDNNCYSSGNHWCAKLQDLMWASQLSQNGGYNRPNSVVRTVSTVSDFFTKVKDGVNLSRPPIVPSRFYYANAGHFWVITGYNDTGSLATSSIYLRDVAISAPIYNKYDRTSLVQDFYNLALINGSVQLLYMKESLFLEDC